MLSCKPAKAKRDGDTRNDEPLLVQYKVHWHPDICSEMRVYLVVSQQKQIATAMPELKSFFSCSTKCVGIQTSAAK